MQSAGVFILALGTGVILGAVITIKEQGVIKTLIG